MVFYFSAIIQPVAFGTYNEDVIYDVIALMQTLTFILEPPKVTCPGVNIDTFIVFSRTTVENYMYEISLLSKCPSYIQPYCWNGSFGCACLVRRTMFSTDVTRRFTPERQPVSEMRLSPAFFFLSSVETNRVNLSSNDERTPLSKLKCYIKVT